MKLFHHPDDFKAYIRDLHAREKHIGFIPTMGALHEGHISLVEQAYAICDTVVASIFVNPAQFNNPDDLLKYPRKPKKDISMLNNAMVHAVFMPSANDMYPKNAPEKSFDFGELEHVMEGAHRPGHFQGVGQIISKLLSLTGRVTLFMGEKDYQQVCIVKKLIELEQLDTKLVVCPTIRDINGLALSSRNERLSLTGINHARNIFKTLKWIIAQRGQANWKTTRKQAKEELKSHKIEVEYLELVHVDNLTTYKDWPDQRFDAIVCFAGYVEQIRLIDNLIAPANLKNKRD